MRIAQLANFVGPTSGGMKVVIESLGQGYVDAGHERIFVAPGPRDEVVETDAGILVSVRAPKVTEQYRMIFAPWRVLDVLQRFRPDSVEVSDKWTLSPAASWARRRDVGSILFSHERLSDMLAMWARRSFGVEAAVGALNRRLSKAFDAVVVTSEFAAEEFVGTGARMELVPLGVDLDTFNPSIGSPVDDGALKFSYVGRLSHEKSPQHAVETVVELHRRGHRVRLDLYGTGPDEAELRAAAQDAPVFFQGFVGAGTRSPSGTPPPTCRCRCALRRRLGWPYWRRWPREPRSSRRTVGEPANLSTPRPEPAPHPTRARWPTRSSPCSPRLGPQLRAAARRQAEHIPGSAPSTRCWLCTMTSARGGTHETTTVGGFGRGWCHRARVPALAPPTCLRRAHHRRRSGG